MSYIFQALIYHISSQHLEVTSEEVHDGKMLKKLVDTASESNNVKGVYDSQSLHRKKLLVLQFIRPANQR